MIDPWLENPLNPTGKADLANLKQVDFILVTHGHFDHLGNAVEIAKKTNAKLVSTYDLGQAIVAFSGYPKNLVAFETQGNFGGELTLLNGEVKVIFNLLEIHFDEIFKLLIAKCTAKMKVYECNYIRQVGSVFPSAA